MSEIRTALLNRYYATTTEPVDWRLQSVSAKIKDSAELDRFEESQSRQALANLNAARANPCAGADKVYNLCEPSTARFLGLFPRQVFRPLNSGEVMQHLREGAPVAVVPMEWAHKSLEPGLSINRLRPRHDVPVTEVSSFASLNDFYELEFLQENWGIR